LRRGDGRRRVRGQRPVAHPERGGRDKGRELEHRASGSQCWRTGSGAVVGSRAVLGGAVGALMCAAGQEGDLVRMARVAPGRLMSVRGTGWCSLPSRHTVQRLRRRSRHRRPPPAHDCCEQEPCHPGPRAEAHGSIIPHPPISSNPQLPRLAVTRQQQERRFFLAQDWVGNTLLRAPGRAATQERPRWADRALCLPPGAAQLRLPPIVLSLVHVASREGGPPSCSWRHTR
jgi:hypothetical protein